MIIPGMKRTFGQSQLINPGEYPTTDSMAAAASRATMMDYNPIPLAITSARTLAADIYGTPINQEKAREIYGQYGIEAKDEMLSGSLTSEGTLRRARIMQEQNMRSARISRARQSTALSTRMLLEGFGVQFLDPANYLVGMIPVLGAPALVASAGKGYSTSKAFKTAMRLNSANAARATTLQAFGRGAIEGVVGNAILEAPTYAMANYSGYDYTIADSLVGIAVGAPFGGVIHAAPKAFRAGRRAINNHKMKAVADEMPDDMRAEFPDSEIMDMAPIGARGADNEISAEFDDLMGEARDVGFDVEGIAPIERDLPIAPTEAKPSPYLSTANDLKAHVRNAMRKAEGQQATTAEKPADMLGGKQRRTVDNRPRPFKKYFKDSGYIKRGSAAHQELIDANVDANYIKDVVRANGRIEGLDNIPASELDNALSGYEITAHQDAGYVDLQWLKDQMRDEVENPPITAAQRERAKYQDQMERLRGTLEGEGVDVENASSEDIAAALGRIADEDARQNGVIENNMSSIINAADDAAEIIQSVSPQTRLAAHTIGMRQMLENGRVDIEPVLALDQKSGLIKPDGDRIARAMEPVADEADVRAYDNMTAITRNGEYADEQFLKDYEEEVARRDKEADIPFEPPTVAKVESEVRKSFGKHTQRIMDTAKIKVVKSADDLPDDFDFGSVKKGDIQGVKTRDGAVYIIADNIDPRENIQGLVLHEIGVHVGLRGMLGNTNFQRLLDNVMASNDPRVRQARKAVPDDTPPQHVAEETLAYLVEYAPHDDFVGNVIGAIKAWLMRAFGMRFSVDEFTARHLAIGALRRVSKLGDADAPDAMFSRATKDGDQAVIPGAERISDKALAERKMEQPLKSDKPQKRMDEGLFGEPDTQTTLFSRRKQPEARKPKKLAESLRIFDESLDEAKNYEPALVAALDHIGDDVGMKKALSENGVTSQMLQFVLDTVNSNHKRVTRSIRQKLKKEKTESAIDALPSEEVARQLMQTLKEKIERDKLNAMRSLVARERAYQRFERFGVGFAYEAIASVLTGSSMLRQGARESISALHNSYFKGWANAMKTGMDRDGLWEQFTKGTLERDVARALERMDDDVPDFKSINPDAVKMARVIYNVREHARITQNSFGADIKSFRNYITRQSHDQQKVYDAKFDTWYGYIIDRLDLEKMNLSRKDAPRALREIYNEIASGNYEVEIPSQASLIDYRSGANIAEKVSKSRELIFKRDQWFDYNQKFGVNTLSAAILKSLDRSGRNAALMRMLGPNPEDNLERLIEMVNNRLTKTDVRAARRFNANKKDALRGMLMVLDGRSNMAGNVTWAKINSNVRAMQLMSKLGGSMLSSMPDLAIYARNFSYEGRGNIYAGIAEAMKGLKENYSTGSNKEILEGISVMFDNAIADIIHQFSKHGTLTDNISASTRVFTKWNLQVPWTVQLQKSASVALSNFLAKSAGKSFDSLSPEIQRMFTLHNITGAKWDVIRKAVGEAEDGRVYLDTVAISRMDDATIAKYIEGLERKVTPESIKKAREAIASDVRAMFIDRAESAVLSSDARTKAAIVGQTKPGDLWGEIRRHMTQFKSYPMMFYERVLKREIYGRGYDGLSDYWARGKGDMAGFSNFIATLMVFGYMSMSIKDALLGREPRPLNRAGTWVEILRRSGAGALYGDFLLQEYNRHAGAGLAESIMGPSVGAAGDILEIVTSAINGDKFASKALRTLQNNMPGANMFYVKPILDNLIMWNTYEAISPGFMKRMERNAIDRTGAQYFAPPSATALRY